MFFSFNDVFVYYDKETTRAAIKKMTKYGLKSYHKEHPAHQKKKLWTKKKRPTNGDFGIDVPLNPTSSNFKTHKTFVLHGFRVHTYTYVSVQTIYHNIINNSKEKKSPPSSVHPKKTKVSGVKSEILIKYKRIKWTPSR